MNQSQKLKRKNTCKRYNQPHYSHPGLKNEAETKTNCPRAKREDGEPLPGAEKTEATNFGRRHDKGRWEQPSQVSAWGREGGDATNFSSSYLKLKFFAKTK